MRRNSMEEPLEISDVHIMLLGSTGSGKSASGNIIIGVRDTFEEDFSPVAVSRVCESAHTVADGRRITVIDTVGLSDTSVKITDAQTEIEQMLQSTYDGIDVFLLVIKLSETFTVENSKVVKWIQKNFGAKFSNHTIVLFTHGDQLHEPIEKYLSECKTLWSIVDQCSGCYHVFNNKDEDRYQVTELMERIKTLRMMNGYRRYTEQDYKENQKELLLKKCAAGAAVGAAIGGLGGAAAAAAIVGAIGGAVGGTGATAGGAVGGTGATAGGAVVAAAVGGLGREAVAEALRGTGGATVASMMGAAALTAEQAALLGAAGGAILVAVAVGAGVYFLKRKYIYKEKDKSN